MNHNHMGPWHEEDSGFLTNLPADCAEYIRQAAIDTTMPVVIGDATTDYADYIGVYTEQPGLELGPFWRRYDELKKEAKAND